MVKVTNFIVGLILVSLVMGVFALVLAEFNLNFNDSESVTIDTQDIETYNLLTNISSQTKSIQNQTTSISEQQNALDVIGSYFSSGYQALALTIQSLTLFNSMADAATDDLNFGGIELFRTALVTIVIVLIIIGVILSAIIKRDL